MSVADKAANVPRRKLRFRRLESAFAICRLPPRSTIPSWFPTRPFTSVTRTNDEASLVCPFESVPEGVQREHPFVASNSWDHSLFLKLEFLLRSFVQWRIAKIPVFVTGYL